MGVSILEGDARERLRDLPADTFQTCVTSPPYFGLRNYLAEGQIGLEQTPDDYIMALVSVFREVRRVLRPDGTLWLNIGDSYASAVEHRKKGERSGDYGLKRKDLLLMPARVALALQSDGWCLRSQIVWHKTNAKPENVKDRPTSAHEMLFLLAREEAYYYDADAISEPAEERNYASWQERKASGEPSRHGDPGRSGYVCRHAGMGVGKGGRRNARNIWSLATEGFREAHSAVMPQEMAERCIKAGSRPGDAVLDPFGGAGTTGLVASRLGRGATLIELSPEYAALARKRIMGEAGLFAAVM